MDLDMPTNDDVDIRISTTKSCIIDVKAAINTGNEFIKKYPEDQGIGMYNSQYEHILYELEEELKALFYFKDNMEG